MHASGGRHFLQIATRLTAFAVAFAPAYAWSQNYPAKAVRLVLPYSPGANADIIARIVSQGVAPLWGQQMIVDYRPGGATNIGSDFVAKSPADGYTLLLAAPPNAINMTLLAKRPYDTLRDFAPIVLCTNIPNVLTIHPSVPAKNLRELIALAKARPGQLNFASGGVGAANHLSGELLKMMAKIDIVHVAYKGSAPAITDAVGGHVEMLFTGVSSVAPLIEAGKLRGIAAGSAKRLPIIPGIPTFAEAGFPGNETSVWFGLMAPTGTPADVVARINTDVNRVLSAQDVRERLVAWGQEPGGGSAGDFGQFVRNEIEKYGKVIRAAGLKAE